MLERQLRFDFDHSSKPEPEGIILDSVEGMLSTLRMLEYGASMHFLLSEREVRGNTQHIQQLTRARNKEIFTILSEDHELSKRAGQKVWRVNCWWQQLEEMDGE